MTATRTILLADRYELGKPLGRGSFAHTYEALDTKTGRRVAVKILDPREAHELKVLELFEREAAVMRSLRHQGIPEIFDVGRAMWNGTVSVIAMELVEGESIQQIIDGRRTLDSGEVMHLFLEMLGILEYIHGRVPQVLHRDIKPANIIVRPSGSPALVDFGSARNEYRRPDEAGSTVAGTYGYMPYEQYMGQATPASDLFALGATFLHMLTGRPPRDFMGASGNIEVPATLPGDERLGPIIERMLRHSPGDRFQSAKEVRQATLPAVGTALTRMNVPTGLLAPAVPSALPVALGPAPREKTPELERWVARLAPSTMDLMYSGEGEPSDLGLWDYASLAFFCTITAGVLPITFLSMANQRRRRIRRFVLTGMPAVARIERINVEKGAFDALMARISYDYEVGGRVWRSADVVLPHIADRWRVGDLVNVLYDPERVSTSIIVSLP